MNNDRFTKLGLYEHNITSYLKIDEAFKRGENIVGIVHATGTGKTYNSLEFTLENKKLKVLFVTVHNSIVEHIENIIANNPNIDRKRDFPNLNFMLYQNFVNMSRKEIEALDIDVLVVDEFHHLGAPVWGSRIKYLIDTHPNIKVLGMSAYTIRDRGTPYERDMANPDGGELFSGKIVSRYDLCDAMIDGVLPKPIYRSAYTKLLSFERTLEKKVQEKELNSKEKEEYMKLLLDIKRRIHEAPSTSEILKKYLMPDGKYIYYCPPMSEDKTNDIDTIMEEMKKYLLKFMKEEDIVFYKTTSKDYKNGKLNRDAFYSDSTLDGKSCKGKLRIMFAINQYNEGVHAPDIDGVILGRGTSSDIVFFEQIGRALSVRGDTYEKYQKFEKLSYEELVALAKEKDIEIKEDLPKEEIIEKLIAPLIIDLAGNIEFIEELETNLKNRVKEITNFKGQQKRKIKLGNASFDIMIENKDLYEILRYVRDRLMPMSWEGMYSLAEQYFKHYGNLEVKYRFKTINGYEEDDNGFNLGGWINNQRQRFKNNTLSKEQIEKLSQIGMRFETRETLSWEEMYSLAEQYFKHYGNLEVKYKFKTINGYEEDDNGFNLGFWISTQRQRFKNNNLPKDQIEKLSQIGMRFETRETLSWEEMYSLAEQYFKHYGNLEVKSRFKTINGYEEDDEGFNLGFWINTQRQRFKNNNLPKDQIEKLSKIGMQFEKRKAVSWEERYSLAEQYFKHYGNLEVKSRFKTINGYEEDDNGFSLGFWISTQRQRFKNNSLPKGRIEKLSQIGMCFEIRETLSWDEMYSLAEQYFKHYGNLEVKPNFKTINGYEEDDNGFNLGFWIRNTRRSFKNNTLSKGQIEKLSQIGMRFETKEILSWEEMYSLAEQYFKHYGNLELKQKFKTINGYEEDDNGFGLGMWINNQRQRFMNYTLPKDQIEKLSKIGMVWDVRNKERISLLCAEYGIDKKLVALMAYKELNAKINYLLSNNLPIFNSDGSLHEIFFMSGVNMEIKYGIGKKELITEYYLSEKRKKK